MGIYHEALEPFRQNPTEKQSPAGPDGTRWGYYKLKYVIHFSVESTPLLHLPPSSMNPPGPPACRSGRADRSPGTAPVRKSTNANSSSPSRISAFARRGLTPGSSKSLHQTVQLHLRTEYARVVPPARIDPDGHLDARLRPRVRIVDRPQPLHGAELHQARRGIGRIEQVLHVLLPCLPARQAPSAAPAPEVGFPRTQALAPAPRSGL